MQMDRFRIVRTWLSLAGAGAVLLCLAGCDDRPKRVPVAGKVLIDGEPLTNGYVTFIPENNRPAVGQIDEQGNFRLTTFDNNDGCVPGTHGVTVVSNQQITPSRMKWLIPKKYMDVSTSGEKVTIEKPTEDLVIKLTWAGGRPYIEDTGGAGDIDPLASQPEATPDAERDAK